MNLVFDRYKMVTMICIIGGVVFYSACDNPFAPRLVTNTISGTGLGDQTTVEGVFQNFRYAYLMKDTIVYGKLLASNFTFIYRNYDKGIDMTWGRDEDMLATSGLFQAAQNIDMVWNDVVQSLGDSVLRDISRGFNLNITFSANDVVRLQGRVNLRITRSNTNEQWKILQWRDESNF
jgi:hypothetical protein